jgi:hypothetical protein
MSNADAPQRDQAQQLRCEQNGAWLGNPADPESSCSVTQLALLNEVKTTPNQNQLLCRQRAIESWSSAFRLLFCTLKRVLQLKVDWH